MSAATHAAPLVIVGAGPAGLVAAISAQRLGMQPTVFEAAQDFQRVGGGLLMQDNGLQVLEALGLLEAFRPHMRVTPVLTTELQNGRRLATVDYRTLPVAHPYTAVVLRHELQEHLLAAARAEGITLHFGHRCNGVTRAARGVTLSFENGATCHADVVLACDGVNSRVREHAGTPFVRRELNSAYIRAVAALSLEDDLVREIWGEDGRRIGICPLPGDRTYLYTNVTHGTWPGVLDRDLDAWLDSWSRFDPLVTRLLRAVPDWHAAVYSETAEISMPRWYDPPLFFLGDAAHAMTPNLGQGGNAAMVDALVLTRLLAEDGFTHGFTPEALERVGARYEHLRKSFVRRTQRTALHAGAAAEATSRTVQRLRDALLPVIQSLPGAGRSVPLLAAGWNPKERPYLLEPLRPAVPRRA